MPYYCTVPRCTSMAGKAKNVSFHQFPRDEELARLWNDILKRGKPYTKYSKVCSLHFRPEDYTITSVGKNKGQWRTLRKDAVPSQNLPSETPAPYSRKQWDSWSQNGCTPSVIDPSIHQHMAQAIYMQTMLAMQASGNTEPHQNGPQIPEMAPHTSTQGDTHINESNSDNISYKCEECTKCFKDPDVFILHKRSHSRKSNGVEKENFNMNLTLRSNPILANLLKTNNDTIDPNVVTMENLLITALAANMDYFRNFSMNKELGDSNSNEQSDLNDSNYDRSGLNHERSGLDDERSDSNVRLHRDINDREFESDSDPIDSNETLRRSIDKGVLSYAPCLSRNDQYAEVMKNGDKINLNSSSNQQSVIHHSKSDHYNQNRQKSEENEAKSDKTHKKSDGDHRKSDADHEKSEPIGLSYAMNFSTKLSDSESLKYTGNYYRDRCSPEYERDHSDGEVNIQNGNVRSHCDDLNESLDSNSLVIDENA